MASLIPNQESSGQGFFGNYGTSEESTDSIHGIGLGSEGSVYKSGSTGCFIHLVRDSLAVHLLMLRCLVAEPMLDY
jgi:hypothetical protein